MIIWTRHETYFFVGYALVVAMLYELLGLKWLTLPWTPIALIGTAVAFLIGFQNNAAYGRIWEARKIWGGIVNTSRSWAMFCRDMVNNEYAKEKMDAGELKAETRILVYRHIAWLSAMRHAMRAARPWETFSDQRSNKEWEEMMNIPERQRSLKEDLEEVLSAEELEYVMGKTNKAATILSLQSAHIGRLKESGHIWEFSFLELEGLLKELFDLQGKSERIKNFPYPRQYATLSYDFVNAFILLLPFGLIPEFAKMSDRLIEGFPMLAPYFVWVGVPFTAIISWIFNTMMRIGTVGENPFEGSANDVPISTIARGIEIDLREMLDEEAEKIPAPLEAVYNVQM